MAHDRPASWRRTSVGLGPRVPMPPWMQAIGRGVRGACPACGNGPLFAGFLAVRPACAECHAPLGEVPSDDAPPYLTMLLAAHPVIALALLLVAGTTLGTAAVLAITLPAGILLCLGLLRPVKGALVAVLLKLDIWRECPDRSAAASDGDRSVRRSGRPDADLTEGERWP